MELFFNPFSGLILGLIAGSFLATIVMRWPQKQAVSSGRSHCDSCDQQLGVFDLIPLASYAISGGKCRYCGASIDPRHMMIELGCALVGFFAFYLVPGQAGLFGALFGWMLVALAALDFWHLWLPDRLVIPLALLGLVSGLVVSEPSLVDRALGGIAGFLGLYLVGAVYFQIRKREGLGGGDPKILGAIGCWLGWQHLPIVLLAACAIGLVWIVVAKLQSQEVGRNTALPLGAYLAIAAFPIWLAQNALQNVI